MYRLLLLIIFLTLQLLSILAQVGGTSTYEFLNLPVSARSTSLGGKVAAIDDSDPAMVNQNPSLLNESMNKSLSLNYTAYFLDINYGYVSYAKKYDSTQMFSAGIQYASYGSFNEADAMGNISGTFKASDYVFNLSYSRVLDSNFSVGVSVKPIFSEYYFYNSAGIASDLGVCYRSNEGSFTASLVLRNAGFQLYAYTPTGREPIPFEVMAGFSQKLKYAPFRFVVTLQQLQHYNLTYDLEENNSAKIKGTENSTNNKIEEIATNAIRHVIAGIEFVPSKNFFASVSLNFKRRSELLIIDKPGMAGFSFGAGVKLSKYRITFGRASYHLAGNYNVFSLSTNLSEFQTKKR